MVTATSAEVVTLAAEVELLLPGVGSAVAEAMVAVLLIVVPFAVFASTVSTTVNVAQAPAARVAMVQLTLPVPPTGGVVQTNAGPVFCASETKIVFGGRGSARTTFCASLAPLFVTVFVTVMV